MTAIFLGVDTSHVTRTKHDQKLCYHYLPVTSHAWHEMLSILYKYSMFTIITGQAKRENNTGKSCDAIQAERFNTLSEFCHTRARNKSMEEFLRCEALSYRLIRDRSLTMGRGGYNGGGKVKFYPTKKGGRNSFIYAQGGCRK